MGIRKFQPGGPKRKVGSKPTANAGANPLVWPEPITGNRLIGMLQRHVDTLRCEPAHGNRGLFLDDVFIAYLLAFFNPTLRSLRTLEDFSQTRQAQKHLSIARICRSTLSDFNRLADPSRLEPILRHLRLAIARKNIANSSVDLPAELKQVLAVDGTFLPIAANVTWAFASRNQRDCEKRRARLDFHVDVRSWIPELLVVSSGESEAESAAKTITPGAVHVYDRGFASFRLMAAHYHSDAGGKITAKASFVARIRQEGNNAPTLQPQCEQPLSEHAKAQGIVSDRLITIPSMERQTGLAVTLREIVLVSSTGETVRLLTNLLDLTAETIAELYRYRWQIELFFRWLKCYANFDHLISHCRGGILLSFYVAIIGTMLLCLHSGGKPSKYLFSLLSLVASGVASLEEILPILRERQRQAELARSSAARRRAKKQAANS